MAYHGEFHLALVVIMSIFPSQTKRILSTFE